MIDWIAATIVGTGLGLALFGCVRLRMHFGPIVHMRYGRWARHAYWLVTILVMVVIANLGLMLLRTYLGNAEAGLGNAEAGLGNAEAGSSSLILEIWFALLALAISLSLIFRQLRSDNCEPID